MTSNKIIGKIHVTVMLLCFLLCCSHSLIFQGGVTAKKRITDTSGEKLPKATVIIAGATRESTTGANDTFTMENVKVDDKLKVNLNKQTI
jgi:hypothetical protein